MPHLPTHGSEQALWDLHKRLSEALEGGGTGAREAGEEARAAMDGLLQDNSEGVDACAAFLRRLDLEVEHFGREVKRTETLLQMAEDMRSRWRTYAFRSLADRSVRGVRGVFGGAVSLSRGPRRAFWVSPMNVPNDCVRIIPAVAEERKVLVKRLRARLLAGEEIEGCWLEDGPQTLRVR